MKDIDIREEGKISEWNEGTFKSIRLHEAQELINFAKANPLRKLPDGRWAYELWIAGIEVLYGEGTSKYKTSEMEEVESIREEINNLLITEPPINMISSCSISKGASKPTLNIENWKKIRKKIELYEKKVKHYNDEHGLSTRNYDDDFRGL